MWFSVGCDAVVADVVIGRLERVDVDVGGRVEVRRLVEMVERARGEVRVVVEFVSRRL